MSIATDIFQHSQGKGLGAHLRDIESLLVSLGYDDTISREPSPNELALLWKRYLDVELERRNASDTLEKIAFLCWFESRLGTDSVEWVQAFRGLGFNLVRTRLEAKLRLGSRLFSRGRKPGTGRDSQAVRITLLPLSVQILSAAEVYSHILPEHRQRTLYGMRGVARLFLARDGLEPAANFRGAVHDLEKSGQLGDHSPEHDEYLREALIKLFDFQPENWVIEHLQPLFDNTAVRNRQYYSDRAKILLAQAVIKENGSDRNSLLNEAVAAADLGLQADPNPETSDAIFKSQRGFAQLLLSQDVDDREKLPALLNSAINDLREAAKSGIGGASLSQALISLSHLTRRENSAEAIENLSEAKRAISLISDFALSKKLQEQISLNEIGITISIHVENGNVQDLPERCNQLLSFGDEAASSFALTLVFAAKLLLRVGNAAPALELGLKATSLIEGTLASGSLDHTPHGVYVLASNAASFLRQLGEDHFERSFGLYREAVNKVPDEILGATFTSAADVALQLGKRAARVGNPLSAANFFHDSVEWYEKGIALLAAKPEEVFEGFLPVVCHSKTGEAYVRLQAVQPTSEYPQMAIKHLETARSLGNNTPELLGLLGDAYYRHGLFHRDGSFLHRALELKGEARAAGHTSRENWSVSASISRKMHLYSDDPKWHVQAIQSAVEAHHADPTWPWPLFQIAEFVETPHIASAAALIDVTSKPHLAQLKQTIELQDRATIELEAVKLAAASVEFKRLILGGRTRVYILDDPHGLISTTVVLKPTTIDNAKREFSALRSFRQFLETNVQNKGFLLPHAIGVIEQDRDRAIYAMKRAVGRRLSDTLLALSKEGRTDQIEFELRRALRYLALFHVWAAKDVLPIISTRVGKIELSRIQEGLFIAGQDAAEFRRLVTNAIPIALLQLRKKDAHAENWIVAGEDLMMIDLEANGYRPLLFEVAQLIDDFGVVSPDQAGFEKRLKFAQFYLDSLAEFGLRNEITRAALEATYATFWILRCAFGIGLFRRRLRYGSSSSLRQLGLRHEHYRRSLAYLATHASSEPVRLLAQWVSGR